MNVLKPESSKGVWFHLKLSGYFLVIGRHLMIFNEYRQRHPSNLVFSFLRKFEGFVFHSFSAHFCYLFVVNVFLIPFELWQTMS